MFHTSALLALIGGTAEIFWTALSSLRNGGRNGFGQVSIWMYPIWFLGGLLASYAHAKFHPSIFIWALIDVGLIWLGELIYGKLTRAFELYLWRYHGQWTIADGLIDLKLGPLWYCLALGFEWLVF